jgi:hypothetical protein
VKREVSPEKQDGAALFFNADTKALETYVPGEGKFYNLQGAVVHAVEAAGAGPTQTVYYLDGLTGQVKSRQKTLNNRYKVRQGYQLDEKTGSFISAATGKAVPREEALSLYVAEEDSLCDLRGNVIGHSRPGGGGPFETEYYLDVSTGEVKARLKAVRDRFTIKDGFALDKKTGQFINKATGQAVPKETAIELRRASATQTPQ